MTHDWSQWGEQKILLSYFGERKGRFLDIGAHAAKENSNTRAMAEMGWGGVCVEPSPAPFSELMKVYRDREDITLVHALVAAHYGLFQFYDSVGDQVSTSVRSHYDYWRHRGYKQWQTIWVPSIKADDLLPMGTFDFLNIDVEGSNPEVLDAVLKIMQPELLCVECDSIAIEQTINAHKYHLYKKTHGNLIARRPT